MSTYNRHRKSTTSSGLAGSVVVLVLILVLLLFISAPYALTTHQYTDLTVTDKSYAGSEDSFIIWMEDEAGNQYEFTNQDQWLRGKFNASTVQGKIKVGSVYNVTTCGWRIPFLSTYENILKYELVESQHSER